MNDFDFINPTRIIFGKGKEETVGSVCSGYGFRKLLIVYGSKRIESDGLLDRVTASLDKEGIQYVLFGGVRPNPTIEKAREGLTLARKEGIDAILAIGGGSPIDTAKSIACGFYYDGDQFDFNRKKAVPQKALPVGVILTHASAGSESSDSAVLQEDATGYKSGYNHPLNRPLFAIENPELTYGVSSYQTACGVADSMMHSLERYFNPSPEYAIADDFALDVVKRIREAGLKIMQNSNDYEARGAMMLLSSLSHDGLTGIGKSAVFVVHPLEHALSGYLPSLAHGAGIALLYPAWARYVLDRDVAKFAHLAEVVFNICEPDEKKRAIMGVDAMEEFFSSMGLPTSFQEVGLGASDIAALVNLASGNGTRVIGCCHQSLNAQDIEAIYSSLL